MGHVYADVNVIVVADAHITVVPSRSVETVSGYLHNRESE